MRAPQTGNFIYGFGLLLLPSPPAVPTPTLQRVRHRPVLLRRSEECGNLPEGGAQVLPAGQPAHAGPDPAARGPVPDRVLGHGGGDRAVSEVRAGIDRGFSPAQPDGVRGVPRRNVPPLAVV